MSRPAGLNASVLLRTWLRWSLLAALVATTAGCGFKLRGGETWPRSLEPVYIDASSRRSSLEQVLRRELRSREIDLAVSPGSSGVIIRILSEQFDQRPLTVGVDGRPREFELAYTVEFAADSKAEAGQMILPPLSRTLTSIYAYDPNTILAKQREAEQLRQALQLRMSELILLRVARLPETLGLNPRTDIYR